MTIRRKIKRAIDGDTFEVKTKIRGTNYIRIAGMDAPEKGEKGYSSAKSKLNKLTGKTVTLIPKGRSYNRLVAEVRHKRKKVK